MKNTSLVTKITVFVVLALIVVSLIIGTLAYILNYNDAVITNSNRALSIAQTIAAAIDVEQYKNIMESGQTNEYYENFSKFLDVILNDCGLIYLYVLDNNYDSDVYYFAEGYPHDGRPDEPRFLLGDTESCGVYDHEMYTTIKTGTAGITRTATTLGGYGSLVSGFAPIKDSLGVVVGVVGVDIAIDEILKATYQFGLTILIISAVMCVAVGILSTQIIKKVIKSLNNVFSNIKSITAKAADGTNQIADNSQAVADGSAEQTDSIEHLSLSINMLSENMKQHTNMAKQAVVVCEQAQSGIGRSNEKMNEMLSVMHEINTANENIKRIVKLIESIAAQTNILALNASVEAARSGEYGKGFAVIAEEVRTLASKSAAAVYETDKYISEANGKITLGVSLAEETSLSFSGVFDGISQSVQIVSEISASTYEQSASINGINQDISQVSEIVRKNSCAANQSAAVSHDINNQTTSLHQIVSQYKVT